MAKKLEILVVEDDLPLLHSLGEFLSLEGHKVSLTSSGEDAIAMTRDNKFDIIFCDIVMAGIKGTGVLFHLRKAKKNTPFVFLTALIEERNRLTASQMGATGYVKKPFDTSQILECIQDLDTHQAIADRWLQKYGGI